MWLFMLKILMALIQSCKKKCGEIYVSEETVAKSSMAKLSVVKSTYTTYGHKMCGRTSECRLVTNQKDCGGGLSDHIMVLHQS